jgi:hypothetical protein
LLGAFGTAILVDSLDEHPITKNSDDKAKTKIFIFIR